MEKRHFTFSPLLIQELLKDVRTIDEILDQNGLIVQLTLAILEYALDQENSH